MNLIPRILILGAGISGLSLGWLLKSHFGSAIHLTLLEKENRTGGWIETQTCQNFLFEQGPRSCRTAGNGAKTLAIIEDLGLQDQLIFPSPSARKRYIYCDQLLQKVPSNPFSMLFSPLTRQVIRTLWREWNTPPGIETDESIFQFISRRFNHHVAEQLIDPLTTGIYAGDIRELSMKSCYPLLFEWEKKYGSLVKGMLAKKEKPQHPLQRKHPLFSLKNGMQTLTDTLARRLEKELLLNTEVHTIHHHSIETNKGQTFPADIIFAALPATTLAKLLKHPSPLQNIPSASVTVVNFGWHKKVLKTEGFGYLIPSKEQEKILGVVWDSSIFPQQNTFSDDTRLAVMIGGRKKANFDTLTKDNFIAIAKNALAKHLGIHQTPDQMTIKIAQKAIPQYLVGHSQSLATIQKELSQNFPRIHLLGNSYYGVSVNDCIAQAYACVERVCDFLNHRML